MSENLYGLPDGDGVWEELEEAVEVYVGQSVSEDGWADAVEERQWPLVLGLYKRMGKPSPEFVLERVLEWLDEELADPDGDETEPTPKMLASMKDVLDEYVPWACETTGSTVVVTMREALAMGVRSKEIQ